MLHGLPVTSPVRTILDAAARLSDRELERAVHEAVVRGLLLQSELADASTRASGRRGAARLKRLIAHLAGPALTRSQAEQAFLELIRAAELPMPLVNSRVQNYEVDFYWPQYSFVVEVDGFQFHRTRSSFERDRRKDAALRAAGIGSMRVTWRQIHDEALATIARLAQALALEQLKRNGGVSA